MQTKLGRIVILVEDYDKAFEFYQKNFLCKKIFESTNANGQRYLHAGFTETDGAAIWFLKADTPDQKQKVGKQTMGQPTIVIYTDDCERLFSHVKQNDTVITQQLVSDSDSKFFQCLDLYGNGLTVVELKS